MDTTMDLERPSVSTNNTDYLATRRVRQPYRLVQGASLSPSPKKTWLPKHRHLCSSLQAAIRENKAEEFDIQLNEMNAWGTSVREMDALYRDTYQSSMLGAASKLKAIGVLERLLEYDIDVNIPDSDGWTALQYVCAYTGPTSSMLVRRILAKKAHVDTPPSRWSISPLCMAAKAGNKEVASILLHAGASVNGLGKKDQSSPLQIACFWDHAEVAELLIDAHAHVNAGSPPPLQQAIEYGSARLVEFLLLTGARVELLPKQCRRALKAGCVRTDGSGWPIYEEVDAKLSLVLEYYTSGTASDIDHFEVGTLLA